MATAALALTAPNNSSIPSMGFQGSPPDVGSMQLPLAGAWTDAQAMAIAVRDFRNAENFRTQNHDWRWQTADEIYLAWVRRRTWEGTRIPRSSLPYHLAFQQIEALLPQIVEATFRGDLDFEVVPGQSNTTAEMAIQLGMLLRYQMQNLDGAEVNFSVLREVIRRLLKQNITYGNGILEWGWTESQVERTYWQRKTGPETVKIPTIGGDGTFDAPTGKMTQWLEQMKESKLLSQPFMKLRDLREFYIDPNCPSPNVQEAQFCATRQLVSIKTLQGLRKDPRFKIPSDIDLFALSKVKNYTQGDNSKSITESYRGGNYQPGIDQSSDPANARVEAIRYWQKDHHVWVLGRSVCAYNQDNEYGAFPFLGICYADVIGRFYGQGICDIVESDQMFAATLLNARVDELNLILHAPIIKKRGTVFPPSMQRIRPGVVWEVDDPANDIIRMEMGNVTQQAFIELEQVDQRTQAKTGVTDLAVLGTPASGGNSANRTATGVSAQTSASNTRVHYQVMMLEDQLVQPLLTIMVGLNQKFLDPNVMLDILGPDGQALQLDPVDVLNSNVNFIIKSASRMKARAALQAGGMAQLLQYVLMPEVSELMSEQQNKTIDIEQVSELFFDTMGLPPKSLFRALTPQEVQAKVQKAMAPMQEKLAIQSQRLQAMQQMKNSSDETKLISDLIKFIGDNPSIQEELAKAFGMVQPSQLNAQQAQDQANATTPAA
jgi:hypothetical protein